MEFNKRKSDQGKPDIYDLLIRIDERTESMDKELIKLNHIVFGNGEEGLTEKVRNLEKKERQRSGHIKSIWSVLGIGAGGALATWITQIFTKH